MINWGEMMKFKKQHILILALALILAFVGGFAGVKLAQPHQAKENSETNLDTPSTASGNTEVPENMDKVEQAFQLIKENYLEDVKDQDLIDGAVKGMLKTLDDPYSTYMDAETMKGFNETIESSFEGIGAEVSLKNGKVTIIAPIKDSPAEDAGLRPNDQVLKVNDESVEGLELYEAVEKIRGKKGSKVVLKVQRPGVSDPFDVTLVRDDIPVETVNADVKKMNGKKTGILEITTFSENTAKEFDEQLTKLEKQGIEGLVIDVRGNPGGLFDAVQDILKMFIPKDLPYVQIEDQNGEKTPYYSDLKKKKDYPISVIVDEGSASASEILAVAMKEAGYDVVGTKSFGKGTVQQAVPMGDGSTIKLTFYKWLSPKGNWIHDKGVEPTIKEKQPNYFYSNPIKVKKPLAYNHTGENIKNIQIMLSGLNYDTGRDDGYFNKQTEQAVKAFQQDNDLKQTGKVDEKTAELIEAQIIDHIREGDDDQQMKKALQELYK